MSNWCNTRSRSTFPCLLQKMPILTSRIKTWNQCQSFSRNLISSCTPAIVTVKCMTSNLGSAICEAILNIPVLGCLVRFIGQELKKENRIIEYGLSICIFVWFEMLYSCTYSLIRILWKRSQIKCIINFLQHKNANIGYFVFSGTIRN